MSAIDNIRAILAGNNIKSKENSMQNGAQFRFADGCILNVYETGKTHWAGKATETKSKIEKLIGVEGSVISSLDDTYTTHNTNKKVFIVYGHDANAREQLELLLRRLRLEPVVLQNLPAAGETIIEKLEGNSEVRYACILLTPDDEGHKTGEEANRKYRARQNVVLETGMFLAKLGRKRVAILHKGDLELPSDINGLLYLKFKDRIDEIKDRIAAELQEAGFEINIKDILS